MYAPQIKEHFRVCLHGPNRLVLATDRFSLIFNGRLFVRLADDLDGATPLHEIARRLRPRFRISDVYAAIALLEAEGCLAEGPDHGASASAVARRPRSTVPDLHELIRGLAPIELWDGPPHLWCAEHRLLPDGFPHHDRNRWRQSFGKGLTEAKARAGAIGEAIERYGACFGRAAHASGDARGAR